MRFKKKGKGVPRDGGANKPARRKTIKDEVIELVPQKKAKDDSPLTRDLAEMMGWSPPNSDAKPEVLIPEMPEKEQKKGPIDFHLRGTGRKINKK